MKIVKKCLLLMVMLFTFTSCAILDALNPLESVNPVSSFSSSQKRVAIVNGTDYVRRKVADRLSSEGWKVSGAVTGKETFAIYFDSLDEVTKTTETRMEYYDGAGNYRGSEPIRTTVKKSNYGYVSVYDLRTNKRLYVYDINNISEDKIVSGIIKAMGKVEENMR
ncbi:hypothetical protein [Fusobacterium polymorphum]|uniref:hypothetical protein n=1 Tax=Fusobacterium nucleatum subsp. polymorphum TaxID=76857 RepID=UPI0030095B01